MGEILFTLITPVVHLRNVPELIKQREPGVGPKEKEKAALVCKMSFEEEPSIQMFWRSTSFSFFV